MNSSNSGRILDIQDNLLLVFTYQGNKHLHFKDLNTKEFSIGDWITWDQNKPTVLTKNRSQSKLSYFEKIQNPKKQNAIKIRTQTESIIRSFFSSSGFIETRTPLLVPCPGMETHIRTFKTESGAFLPTSPEFAMKRLLVGGLEKIFQICPAFRYEAKSDTHLPEFTMLEWYRALTDYEEIMKDTENLIIKCAYQIHNTNKIQFNENEIDLTAPWPRKTVKELFKEYASIDLKTSNNNQNLEQMRDHCKKFNITYQKNDTWDDLYFRIWLNVIEPKIPKNRPMIVYEYPGSQSALATKFTDSNDNIWAKRFEIYIAGIELANAFQELTDPIEQEKRFIEDMESRTQIYGDAFPKTPIDHDFLNALKEGMPPSSGIALGVDRLIMLLANEIDIRNTFWLDPFNDI